MRESHLIYFVIIIIIIIIINMIVIIIIIIVVVVVVALIITLHFKIIQRRTDGSENFYRTWNEYRDGFGDLSNEFWLGMCI